MIEKGRESEMGDNCPSKWPKIGPGSMTSRRGTACDLDVISVLYAMLCE